jgi:hypothetical protein
LKKPGPVPFLTEKIMTKAKHPVTTFQQGDEVVLAHGGNQGTPGVFVRLRTDPNWADIMERNGVVKSHPVEWLARAA